MKKLFTLLGIVVASACMAQSTISNPSFESWGDVTSMDSLEQWYSSSAENYAAGRPVDNTYSVGSPQHGSSALHLETVEYYDIFSGDLDTLFGYAVLGNPPGASFPTFNYTDTVDNFTGYYKCNVVPGDTAIILVELYKAGVNYATGVMQVYGAQASWTEFNVPIIGGQTDSPDSLFLGFTSSDPFTPGIAKAGSWLEIDSVGLEFTSGTAVPSALPNNSMEDFYTEVVSVPSNWWTMDPHLNWTSGGSTYATESSDAYAGSSSLEITTTLFNVGASVPAVVTNGTMDYFNMGTFEGGDPFIAQPDSLKGYYKYSTLTTDTAWFGVTMWNAGTGILIDSVDYLLPSNTWAPFGMQLGISEAPDSMRLIFYSGEALGSEFLVDDLSFIGGDLGFENRPNTLDWNFYPNPADHNIVIHFQEAQQLDMIDITGKIIYRSNIEDLNSININTQDLINGVYFLRIRSNGVSSTKKLIINH